MAKDIYKAFCQKYDLPIFMQDWYLDAVCENGVWDAALVEKDGEAIAVWPYFLKTKWIFRYITMPHFVKFMGPYVIPEYRTIKEEERIIKDLINQLPKFHSFKQNFYYHQKNWLPLHWKGFKQTTQYSYVINMDSLEKTWEAVNRNMKRNIRKAKSLVSVSDDLDLETFYSLNQMSFDRQEKKIPYTFELLRKHDEALQKAGQRKLFFAVDGNDQVHSAAYLIWDEQSAYYHLSGDDPKLRKSGAGILLIWEAIKYTFEVLGLKRFDFEGSMIKNVELIRRQFGALQEPYFFIWKDNSSLFKLLERVKK